MRRNVPALALLCALAACEGRRPAQATPPDVRTGIAADRGRHVPGEVLVKFRAGTSPDARATAHRAVGTRALGKSKAVRGLERVRLPPGMPVANAVRAFAARAEVEWAEPNYVVTALAVPNDPRFPEQWSLRNGSWPGRDIHAVEAWDLATGTRDAVVAVIDSGIDYTHPDLAANVFRNEPECVANGVDDDGNGWVDDCHGVDVEGGTSDPMDDAGHGTHVAGIVGAVGNDGQGIAGVAWQASILACRFLDASGYGTAAGAVACLDYVAQMKDAGVNVVASNDSWAVGEFSRAVADAIEAHRQRGILFVTASGNEGADDDVVHGYPCTDPSPNVICVGSSRWDDVASPSSNGGVRTVHLLAPGDQILSTVPMAKGGYAVMSGTSMAAPHVTGTVALLHARDPGADWRAVKNLVLATVAPSAIPNTITGGRLDAYAALTCARAPMTRRLDPRFSRLVAPGTPILLRVMNVDCGRPDGEVVISIAPSAETVTLRDDGAGPDVAAGDGVYAATWVPTAEGRYDLTFPGDDHVFVDVDRDLERGFPQKAWVSGGTASGWGFALVGDVDGEPGLEILTTAFATGPLYAWKADGTPLPGWPVLEGGFGAAYPSLAKLSRTIPGSQVVATYFGDGVSDLPTAAYDGGGNLLPGWPVFSPASEYARAPLVVDVDGDGIDEVFRDLPDYYGGLDTGGSPAAADLFGDGRTLFLVTGTNVEIGPTIVDGALTIMDVTGAPITGFPVSGAGGLPVVGDVDGDGEPEIVMGRRIMGVNGLVERDLPLVGDGAAPVALADLDGDGFPEIIVQTTSFGWDVPSALNCFRGDGTPCPGWPIVWDIETEAMGSAPMVGDVDGDGLPDVVVTTHVRGAMTAGDVRVYSRDGVLHPRFPKKLPLGLGAHPAIADVDGDGRNEIVVVGEPITGRSGFFDKVWVYDLGGAAHGPVLWGQYMGNAGHTGAAPLTVRTPRRYEALEVTATGYGTVTAPDVAIGCVEDSVPGYNICGSPVSTTPYCGACSRLLVAGTPVVLTAAPWNASYVFKGWTGACSGSAPTCTVTVDARTEVGAAFGLVQKTLTVERAGDGTGTVTSSPAGIACGSTCASTFDTGALVVLSQSPAAGSRFTGWSGACSGTSERCVLEMSSALSVTASFTRNPYPLSVGVTGVGTVTSEPAGIDCGSRCSASYPYGTEVTLRASAGAGYELQGWTGACSGSGDACTVAMTDVRSVTVAFVRSRYALAVTREGTGAGSVSSSPGGIVCGTACSSTYLAGTVVTLTATPGGGSDFAGWSGDCSGAGWSCTVAMDGARSVAASFTLRPVLRVTRAGAGTGTVASSPAGISCGSVCTGAFDPGARVTLSATPAAGSVFSGWSGACSGTDACVVALGEDASVTATFEVAPPSGSGGGGGCATGQGARFDAALLAAVFALFARWRARRRVRA